MVERLEKLISEQRIRARTAALARRIDADYRGRELALLVVLKGALVFAADLMRHLSVPFTLDFLTATSYGAGTQSSGTVALAGLERIEIGGRHVLIIEDILDTGRTFTALIADLRPHQPAGIALCALLGKPAARVLDLPVAYIGFEIGGEFVVGWGMDHAERYRNLRGVYRLILDGDG